MAYLWARCKARWNQVESSTRSLVVGCAFSRSHHPPPCNLHGARGEGLVSSARIERHRTCKPDGTIRENPAYHVLGKEHSGSYPTAPMITKLILAGAFALVAAVGVNAEDKI